MALPRLFDRTIYETTTSFEHYQVVDTVYNGRPARVLFSGKRAAVQSGIAYDDNPAMLFDYNQRFMELATGLNPAQALLIGGGAYTLPMALAKALPMTTLTVVERDPDLAPLARRFFNLEDLANLKLIAGDGRQFVDESAQRYDLIMIDAFSDLAIPTAVVTQEAIAAFGRRLTPTGVLAINIIAAYNGATSIVLRRIEAGFAKVFRSLQLFPAEASFDDWQPQNSLLIGATDPINRHMLQTNERSLVDFSDVAPLRD